MTDLSKIFLYRMTHIENIPHILEHGITHIHSPNANKDYVPIGDGSLIATRDSFQLPNGNRLGDYIPFYFGPRMPMLYVMQYGRNNVKITAAEDVVYCVSSIAEILKQGIDFVFTDGHAVAKLSTYYNPTDVDTIEQYLDRKAIASKYGDADQGLDFKRRKEAEFLVATDIPRQAIIGFATFNQKAMDRLKAFGVTETIGIRPQYYF